MSLRRVASLGVLLLFVIPALLALGPATASAPLVADAGDSRAAFDGGVLPVSGAAFGGAAPYAFAWSWNGDAARFADASAAQTTFDTAGLAPQDVLLTLTVTDDNGAVATDIVRGRVEATTQQTQNMTILGGALNVIRESMTFEVASGIPRIEASLDWDEPIGGAYDIDFELLDPSGNSATGNAGFTTAKPERVAVDNPAPGTWTAAVYSFVGAPTEASLTVTSAPNPIPIVVMGPHVFGSAEPQLLTAYTGGGAAPFAFAWDLDADGVHETAGDHPVASFPLGTHVVGVKITDAVGFEVRTTGTVEIRTVDAVLHARCGGGDSYWTIYSMEFSSTKNTCWIHGGHHTYFFGEERYGLRSLSGFVFTVEQQFSPPMEFVESNPTRTPLHVQVSEDGSTWTEVAPIQYRFASNLLEGEVGVPETRQRIDVTLAAAGESFRFLRIHEPLSAAQGLSGYLDNSEMHIEVDQLAAPDAGPASTGRFALSCDAGDIMEDFFATHPCWFGGIDRWDAAGFWHTYPVGDGGVLDAVSGTATLLPFRTDDWNDENETENSTRIGYVVQVSTDGMAWTDLARVEGEFGLPIAFDVPLSNTPARFVRLFPDYHAGYDDTTESPPYHHPRGYLVHSAIEVEGHVRV